MELRPFRIDVPDAVLDDLRNRLGRTRWPEQIESSDWDYGVSVDEIRQLCEVWRTSYDWRRQEERLNAPPQFLCEVDGLDLHFWHIRGTGPEPLALLLLHGWPGSVIEFAQIAGPLSRPSDYGADAADGFDLVIPDLPGFGFGGQPREPGWGPSRIAAAFDALMTDGLGYGRYAAHGGDWGALLAGRLGAEHAANVVGIHLAMPYGTLPADATEADRRTAAALALSVRDERGYSAIQRTKPDTLTVAQTDSPAGLAAWIVEKFRTWSDGDGDVTSVFSPDILLTNLMMYWAPQSVASAARIYFEAAREPGGSQGHSRVSVPTGVAVFPAERFAVPRAAVESLFNVQRYTEMPAGGHFGALEQPELLVDELRAFFRPLRS